MRLRFLTATASLLAWLLVTSPLLALDYDVGPGHPNTAIADVPWESLMPGDTVRIHWRPDPYREKWVIGRQGLPNAPITVQGVPGPGGERPVISGENATTPLALDFWNDERGLIKIGGSSIPPNTTPEWIVIEGLELRSAHLSYGFTDDRGNAVGAYASNAAGLYVEVGRNLVIRDCVFHDNGNGIFIGSPDANPSTDILIEGNRLFGNGNVGSAFHHNSYTTALGIVIQDNYYGPLRDGSDGNNLKDRSGGLVVRNNWIEAGNRQLDLVESNLDSSIEQDLRYRVTHVYGNVLVETEGAGNRQVVHYGGDNGDTTSYRKGTLYFYNNTIVSERAGRTTLFRLSSNDETCDARNNVVYLPAADGDQLELLSDTGTLDWTHAWLEPGWSFSFFGTMGTFNDAGTTIEGTDPGFTSPAADDFTLRSDSDLRDAGTTLPAAVLPDNDVTRMPTNAAASTPRPVDARLDIGAYELATAAPLGEVLDLRVDAGTALGWSPTAGATGYDVVRGDVLALRPLGLGASVIDCVVTDLSLTQLVDSLALPPSRAAWYLVRARNSGGVGSWGGGRDAAIDAAPGACAP